MKTKRDNFYIILILTIVTVMIALLVSVSIPGCQNSDSNSSLLEKELDFGLQEPGSDEQPFAEALKITSAVINISDLHIKEDSGNDDVILEGPYTIELDKGIVTFDRVDMFTGTYKKVNLIFQTSDSTTLNGHSILITGYYLTADGKTIPFNFCSDFTKQIQLPLLNDGVTVNENSTVSISFVFDANAWLSVLDFADAQIANGEIAIDNDNNTSLLSLFEANLSPH